MTTGLAKCPRRDCNGQIITDWYDRQFCSLCGREYGVPLVQFQPEHEPPWKPRKCTCVTRYACKAHPEPAA